MHTASPPRRRLALSLVTTALALVAGCGGSSKPAPANATPPGDGPPPTAGTSGLPGLDWGATAAAVLALHPRGTADDAGVTEVGMVDGHHAITVFSIGADGLSGIDVEWTEGFASMDACSGGWKQARATLDAQLGASTQDNLAAYWDTPTASITLACNPNDSDAGVLSLRYAPRTAE